MVFDPAFYPDYDIPTVDDVRYWVRVVDYDLRLHYGEEWEYDFTQSPFDYISETFPDGLRLTPRNLAIYLRNHVEFVPGKGRDVRPNVEILEEGKLKPEYETFPDIQSIPEHQLEPVERPETPSGSEIPPIPEPEPSPREKPAPEPLPAPEIDDQLARLERELERVRKSVIDEISRRLERDGIKVSDIENVITNVVDDRLTKIENTIESQSDIVDDIETNMEKQVNDIVEEIKNETDKRLDRTESLIDRALDYVSNGIYDGFQLLVSSLENLFSGIVESINSIKESIVDFVSSFVETINNAVDRLVSFLTSLFTFDKDKFYTTLRSMIDLLKGINSITDVFKQGK